MGRKSVLALMTAVILLVWVVPVLAQAEPGAAQAAKSFPATELGSAFAMAIAAAGCGYGQSRALTAACEGVSRNPGATDTIRLFLILGLAFIEFLALLTFVVILLLM